MHGTDETARRLLDPRRPAVPRPGDRDRLGRAGRRRLRAEPGVEHALRHAVLGRADRAQRRELTRHEAASVASTGIWFELILQQTDPPRCLRLGPGERGVPVGADRDRRRVPALDHVRPGHGPAGRRLCTGRDAHAELGRCSRLGHRRDGVRRDPGRRRGARCDAARLDARSPGRAAGADGEPHPRRRGIAAHGVRPGGDPGAAGRYRRAAALGECAGDRAGRRHDRQQHGHPRGLPNAGLDADRAVREARRNEHHRALLRSSCANLMDFLGEVGLLTPAATRVYRRTGLR